ncbi:MAG: ABC transporter ATP-binding protein [Bacteroidia bacterium]
MDSQSSAAILTARNLQLANISVEKNNPLIQDLSFSLGSGQIVALIGASGAGKSALIRSVLRFDGPQSPFKLNGELLFSTAPTSLDLIQSASSEFNIARSRHIAWIAQDSYAALNPTYTCKDHLEEARRFAFSSSAKYVQAQELLSSVGLPIDDAFCNAYPNQLSGGQIQRLQIACALAKNPILLFADEPVSSLDPINRNQILTLLKTLAQKRNMGVFLVSHDLESLWRFSDEVIVLEHGIVVEQGCAQTILERPKSAYGKTLMQSKQTLLEHTFLKKQMAQNAILSISNLSFSYLRNESNVKHKTQNISALDAINLEVFEGEILGIVGSSGSGKSTLARCLAGLETAIAGKINTSFTPQNFKQSPVQLIFQDAAAALNPYQTLETCLREALRHAEPSLSKYRFDSIISELFLTVGLSEELKKRMPHQISGGQRQRFCVARALCFSPNLMLFDEALSALDVVSQIALLRLIRSLNEEKKITMVFVSHDLQAVRYISHRIAVISEGKIIEVNSPEELFRNPQQECTQKLIDATFSS